MSKLIEVADERTDANWMSGLEVEGLQCSLRSFISPLCLPVSVGVLSGTPTPVGPSGYGVTTFGVTVDLKQPVMCRTSDPDKAVRDGVDAEFDTAMGRALWYGVGNSQVWFGHPSATVAADLGAALQAFYDRTVGVDPVIHMGVSAALSESTKMVNGRYAAFPEVPIVVNPGYPTAGVAVSGPIEYWRGEIENIQVHNVRINRETTAATMLAAVMVDPCTVVVVGDDLPAQVHVSQDSDEVTVLVVGTGAASVDWGDGDPDSPITIDTETDSGQVSHTFEAGSFEITVTTDSGTTKYTVVIP